MVAVIGTVGPKTVGRFEESGITYLPASNGSDDTSVLNAVLLANANKYVRGKNGETYKISIPLVVQSGCTLDMTNCTVSLNSSSNCNMLRNAAVTANRSVTDGAITSGQTTLTSATAVFTSSDVGRTVSVAAAATGGYLLTATITARNSATSVTLDTTAGATVSGASVSIYARDAGITIIGGTWARGSNTGSGTDLHSLRLRYVDGLTIRDLSVTSSAGKYAVSLAGVTRAVVENLYFSTASDGVHLAGPSARVTIRDIFGTTGDDLVAVTPQDWDAYSDSCGDVTDVSIDNVYLKNGIFNAVKLLGGAAGALKRVRVRNVYGTSTTGVGVTVGDDNQQASTTGGFVDQVSLENIQVVTPNNRTMIWLNGTNTRHVRISGAHFDNGASSQMAIRVAPSSAATFKSITITDFVGNAIGSTYQYINVESNATVSRMVVSRSHFSGLSLGAVIDVRGTIASLLVDQVTLVTATGTGGGLVRVFGTVTDLAVRGVTLEDVTSLYVVNLDSSTAAAVVTRLTMSDVHISAVSGGGFLAAAHASHTLPSVELANATATAAAWVADLNVTTELHMSNVSHVSSANGMFNLRTSAALTVRGAGLNLYNGGTNLTLTGGAVARSKTLAWSVDVSKLTQTAGDLATNTNGGLGCGTGPVISNGTLWKHLYTGSTG